VRILKSVFLRYGAATSLTNGGSMYKLQPDLQILQTDVVYFPMHITTRRINIGTRRRHHVVIVKNTFQSKMILSIITYQHFHLSYLMFQITLLQWNQHSQQHHDDQFLLILDLKDPFLFHKGISYNSPHEL